MEDEDFRIIEHLDRTFKCFRDGRVFIKRSFPPATRHKDILVVWKECCGVKPAFGSNHTPYQVIRLDRKCIKVHRVLGKAFLGLDIDDRKQMIDHIDGNGLNNSFENLRVVTNQINTTNYHTAIKGVQLKHGKYYARIGGNGKFGSPPFETKEEALEWRRAKEIEMGYLTRATGI